MGKEKNTVSINTNPKVASAVSMEARTCYFHRTVFTGRMDVEKSELQIE
jgi:hypothetical protein